MAYRLSSFADAGVIRLSDGATIPADPRNRDYQEFLEWQAAGNKPDPAPELPPLQPEPPATTES